MISCDELLAAPDSAAPPPATQKSRCLMPDASGRMVSCDHLLGTGPATAPPAAPQKKPAGDVAAKPTPAKKTLPYERKKHVLDEALKRPPRFDPKQFPLLAIRDEMLRAQVELEARVYPSHEKEAELAFADEVERIRGVVGHVERQAERLVTLCALRLGIKRRITAKRMTAAGAIPLTAAEMKSQIRTPDPPGCERAKLVDATLIAQVRRLHEIDHELATRNFGFHEGDARRALQAEREKLKDVLGENRMVRSVDARGRSIQKTQPLFIKPSQDYPSITVRDDLPNPEVVDPNPIPTP
jgi:hypothetical protein